MNKTAVIILNGKIKNKSKVYKKYSNSNKYDIYCADGGANHALDLGLIPKSIIGDLDSITKKAKKHFKTLGVPFEKHPIAKDYTDGELIINKFYDKYNEIIILGGQGGRTDHFLSNLFLLEKYPKIKFVNHREKMFLVQSGNEFLNMIDTTISFIPIDKVVKQITLTGFKYPLTNYTVERGSSITMSNIIQSDRAIITFEEGKLLAIINYTDKF